MQPLFQWAVLAGELHNFLSNNSSEECWLGTNWARWVYCSVNNDFFFNVLYWLSSFCFSLFIYTLSDWKNFCGVVLLWVSPTFLMESVDSSYGEMKLDGPTEVSQITVLNIAACTRWWISITCSQVMVGSSFGYLYVLNKTLSAVRMEFSWVKFDLECERSLNTDNLDWFSIVYFSHAFDFDKPYIISFLVRMAFVFVYSYCCLLLICNWSDNERFCLFSIGVRD